MQICETTELEVDLAEMAKRVTDMPPMPGIGVAMAEPREKPTIDDVLVTPVHEGGTNDWSRFEGTSAAIDISCNWCTTAGCRVDRGRALQLFRHAEAAHAVRCRGPRA